MPNLKIEVAEPTAYQVTVNVRRLNPAQKDYRMYAPNYPKPQTEGFFLVVTDARKESIVALKRVTWPIGPDASKQRPANTARATFKVPEHDQPLSLHASVISDGYIDMTWDLGEIKVPGPPVVTAEDGGKKG